MASSEEVQQLRELIILQASQLEAVAKELTSQRSAAAQVEARSSLSLVDTKLLTKPNVYSGELDGKERWTTRSFKMRAYCAVMATRMSELMGSASKQDQEIRQDAMTPNDAAHSTNLYYMLSLLTDGEALDVVQNSPVVNGMEVWRRTVMRWEPKVPSSFRGLLQAILFPRLDIPGSDVTQLLTAWEKQVLDYKQQGGDTISDAIKLGIVLRHLPDAALREHWLLNSQSYDKYSLMAAETRSVAMARTTWSGPVPVDLCLRWTLFATCAGREVILKETVGSKQAGVMEKERKARRAREVKQRAPHPKMETPRRKSQTLRIPAVDSIYTA